jgi:hypothetical protein
LPSAKGVLSLLKIAETLSPYTTNPKLMLALSSAPKISIGIRSQKKLSEHSQIEHPLLENSYGLIALPQKPLKPALAEKYL